MVLALGREEKALTHPFPFLPGGEARTCSRASPSPRGHWQEGDAPGSALAKHSEHVLGSLREPTAQSPREGLRKSHHPLPAAWPSSSGFL